MVTSELVSIIMPAYNATEFILESIDSVLQQTYPNWELLVVDDCSSDDTYKLVEQLCTTDVRIKLYCLERNSGVAAARNFAINKSAGKYLAFLDSDDLWLPEKIEAQMELIQERADISLVFCDYESFGGDPGLPGFERGPILKTLQVKGSERMDG